MKRKAQLLSLDAMLSLVIVILMLGTISSTSTALKSEITSMTGWYGRINIADNMMDVLTKSPGEPADWYLNTSNVSVVGLAGNYTYGISYDKVTTLINAVNLSNKKVEGSLLKLSDGKDFELAMYTGKWNFTIGYNWNANGTSSSESGNYMPLNLSCTVDLNGAQTINPPAPSSGYTGGLVSCQPFQVIGNGALFFSYDYNLCFAGSILAPSTNAGSIHLSNIKSGSYISIAGDLISEKQGAIFVSVPYGSLYVGGSLWLDGVGSQNVEAEYIYILGNTGKSPLISITAPSSQVQATAGLLFNVNGVWYLAQNFQINSGAGTKGNWFKLVNGQWENASSDVNIDFKTEDVYINGVHVAHGGEIYAGTGSKPTITLPPCIVGSTLPIEVNNATIHYTFPSNITQGLPRTGPDAYLHLITEINGSFWTNPPSNVVEASMNASPWVELAERRTAVVIRKYSSTMNVTGSDRRVLAGELMTPVSPYLLLEVNVPNETGYALFAVQDGNKTKILGIWRTHNVTGAGLWKEENGNVSLIKIYRGNSNSVTIPWIDLFSEFNINQGMKVVGMWLYKETFSYVTLHDIGGIGALLAPKREPFVIKLWVWDDS